MEGVRQSWGLEGQAAPWESAANDLSGKEGSAEASNGRVQGTGGSSRRKWNSITEKTAGSMDCM